MAPVSFAWSRVKGPAFEQGKGGGRPPGGSGSRNRKRRPFVIVHNGGPAQSIDEAVLFSFDSYSLPFQQGVAARARSRTQEAISIRGTDSIRTIRERWWCPRADPAIPDCREVCYYGSVLRVGGEFRMWYLGPRRRRGPAGVSCPVRGRNGVGETRARPGGARRTTRPTTWWSSRRPGRPRIKWPTSSWSSTSRGPGPRAALQDGLRGGPPATSAPPSAPTDCAGSNRPTTPF